VRVEWREEILLRTWTTEESDFVNVSVRFIRESRVPTRREGRAIDVRAVQ